MIKWGLGHGYTHKSLKLVIHGCRSIGTKFARQNKDTPVLTCLLVIHENAYVVNMSITGDAGKCKLLLLILPKSVYVI